MEEQNDELPQNRHVKTDIPGPRSREIMSELAQLECPALTSRRLARAKDTGCDCPIVWERGLGMTIEDVDGNRYWDFCGGFAVAANGYTDPIVLARGRDQLATLNHCMGDAFTSPGKLRLMQELKRHLPPDYQRIMLGNSGSDAVEAAMKTAVLYARRQSHRPFGLLCFSDAYHGLSIGALNVSAYTRTFREPFSNLLSSNSNNTVRMPYPKVQSDDPGAYDDFFATLESPSSGLAPISSIILEPILGRGGIQALPKAFGKRLTAYAKKHNCLVIADEIYTGCYRTGTFLASPERGLDPDIVCLGKGMSGGVPISAMVAKTGILEDAWQDSQGEAIHTSTFLGNPFNCAMAEATLKRLRERDIGKHVSKMGHYFAEALRAIQHDAIGEIRAFGLMIGVEIKMQPAFSVCQQLLQQGIIVLPCGVAGNILCITPPLILEKMHVDAFVEALLLACDSGGKVNNNT